MAWYYQLTHRSSSSELYNDHDNGNKDVEYIFHILYIQSKSSARRILNILVTELGQILAHNSLIGLSKLRLPTLLREISSMATTNSGAIERDMLHSRNNTKRQ